MASYAELQVGTTVRDGSREGVVSERYTTRSASGPHREVTVRFPGGATKSYVNDAMNRLKTV